LSPRRDDSLSFDRLIQGVPILAHSSAPNLPLFGDRIFQNQPVRLSSNNSPTAIAPDNLASTGARHAARVELLARRGTGRCIYSPAPRAWRRYRASLRP